MANTHHGKVKSAIRILRSGAIGTFVGLCCFALYISPLGREVKVFVWLFDKTGLRLLDEFLVKPGYVSVHNAIVIFTCLAIMTGFVGFFIGVVICGFCQMIRWVGRIKGFGVN